MNRIMGRARIMLVLILVLALGMGFFLGEYALHSDEWVQTPGSPHIFDGHTLASGLITDREGVPLLDLKDKHTYSESETLRKAMLHWLGDRQGNIRAPILSAYAMEIAGYDPVNGVYAYGNTGGRVNLSLSAKVQTAALEAMGNYRGTVAVYNYKTGEIICAVTTPTYDPDNVPDIAGDTEGKWAGAYVNRFTQSTYTPGSIYKIVTMAAALDAIPDIESQTFTCTGTTAYGNDKVTCTKAHGKQTLKEAFSNSCNCAFAAIAGQLGGETLERYAQQFHVNESISFDGLKTAEGKLEAANAADVMVAWSAIGQHKDLINPCAFLTFVGAVANDGVPMSPHIVNRITVGSKTTYQAPQTPGGRIMSSEVAKKLQEYMRYNTESYYGDENFPGLSVCAKSGTAQVGGNKKPNAMFTGFVTNEEYPLAFIACVEDSGYGRPICVPIISKILQVCKAEIDAGA